MITFDFDETLTRPTWDSRFQVFEPSDTPNYDAFEKLNDYHKAGKEVRIVTTRSRPDGVAKFVERYEIPITSIHCTAGELKGKLLKTICSELHFDDSEKEAIYNQTHGIPTILVSYRFDAINQKELCDFNLFSNCLLYTSPSPRDRTRSRMPSSA